MKDALKLWDQTRPILYQTDAAFATRSQIKPYGCYFVALTQVLANVFRVPWGHAEAIHFYDAERLDDADGAEVGNEALVQDPQGLADDLVGKGKVEYIQRFIPPTEPCPQDVLQFGRWHKTGKSYFHFTFCNGKGVTLIDTWSPEGSDSVRDGFLMDWRGFRIL